MPTQISAGELKGARHLVRTSTGDLYAVFEDGGSVEVWYSADGSSWVQKDAGSSPSCRADSPVGVAIDSNDILHIVYNDNVVNALNYITFDTLDGGAQDDAFNTEEEAIGEEDGINIYFECAITIDSNNIPHAIFVDSKSSMGSDYHTIYYANRIGGVWNAKVEVDGVSNQRSSRVCDITVNGSDIPLIVYVYSSLQDVLAAKGNQNNANSFTLKNIDDNMSMVNLASMAVDSNGDAWITYIDVIDVPPYVVVNIAKQSANWTDAWSISTDNDVGSNPSLVVDGTDIYIFYAVSHVYYNKYTGSWAGEVVLEIGGYLNVKAKWSYLNNNQGSIQIDYLFKSGTDVYWSKLDLVVAPTYRRRVIIG